MLRNFWYVALSAEAEEETVEQKFAKFGQRLTEMGETLAEKAKHTLEKIQNNEFTVMSR